MVEEKKEVAPKQEDKKPAAPQEEDVQVEVDCFEEFESAGESLCECACNTCAMRNNMLAKGLKGLIN
eukprot:1139278-Pelagomonas_calceolata.AAC.1